MRVALSKRPKKDGPGLIYILVALVVVAVAGARFLGFSPSRGDGPPPPRKEGYPGPMQPEDSRVLPRPSQMTEVLIYHTHTSENSSPGEPHARGEAGDVVAVGRALVEALREQGVGAVHVLTVHDLPDWSGAVARARQSVQEAINRHNGIRAVVDLHRDALPDQGATGYASAQIDGEEVAKILLIVGTSDNSRVDANMRYAERLKERLEELAPGITRGVRVMPRATNGDLHDNHVTVYVGDYRDNTLQEAVASARWLAMAIAELLKEDG